MLTPHYVLACFYKMTAAAVGCAQSVVQTHLSDARSSSLNIRNERFSRLHLARAALARCSRVCQVSELRARAPTKYCQLLCGVQSYVYKMEMEHMRSTRHRKRSL